MITMYIIPGSANVYFKILKLYMILFTIQLQYNNIIYIVLYTAGD